MIFCKPCVVPLDPPRNRVHLNLDGTCDNMNTVATFQVRQHFVVFVTSFWYLNLLLGDLFLYIPKKINFTFNCFLIEVHIIPSSTIPNVDWLGAEINHVVALNNWKYDIKLLKIIHTAEFFLQGSVYFSEVKYTYTKKTYQRSQWHKKYFHATKYTFKHDLMWDPKWNYMDPWLYYV